MRIVKWTIVFVILIVVTGVFSSETAQTPPTGQRGTAAEPQRGAPAAATPADPARGGRGGGGQRGGFQTMTLVTTAWPDGGMIPLRYTQAGAELSPAIQWSGVPTQNVASFVVTFTDTDTVVNNATDGLLHWMLWNIPPTATGVTQGRPDGFELEDGTRQISVSGARYRGPGASSTGPMHHYLLEVYALDTMLDVKIVDATGKPIANPQGPQDPNPNVQATRKLVFDAMVGHIRGKASYMGLFRRPQ